MLKDFKTQVIDGIAGVINLSSLDIIKQIKEILNRSIYIKSYNEVSSKEKLVLDQIYLYIFSEELLHLNKKLIFLKDFVNNSIKFNDNDLVNTESSSTKSNKSSNKLDELKILNDTIDKLKAFINFNINNFIENSLTISYNNLNIENFVNNNQKLIICCKNFLNQTNTDLGNIITKPFNDFLFQFFEEKKNKLAESIELDEFNHVEIVAPQYQQMINFICTSNFQQILKFDIQEKFFLLEKIGSVFNDDASENNSQLYKLIRECLNVNNEQLNQGLLLVSNNTYKCCFFAFEMVKFIYDTVKIVVYFGNAFFEQAFMQVNFF